MAEKTSPENSETPSKPEKEAIKKKKKTDAETVSDAESVPGSDSQKLVGGTDGDLSPDEDRKSLPEGDTPDGAQTAGPGEEAALEPEENQDDPAQEESGQPDEPDAHHTENAIEAEAEEHAEHVPDTPDVPTQRVEVIERRGGAVPLVLAGVITALIGFLAGRSELLDPYLPGGSTGGSDVNGVSVERVEGLSAEITGLRDQIAAVDARVDAVPAPAESPDLSALEDMTARLAEIDARLSVLEARPVPTAGESEAVAGVDPEELAALTRQLAAQQAAVDTLQARLDAAQAEATAEAELTLARAALNRLVAAVDSGAPFADALNELDAVTDFDIPEALRATAADGVATLTELQVQVSDAARTALAAARNSGEAETEGLGGFLKRQLGQRSLEPRDGDDADAVLSRIEAAIRGGNLSGALAEAEALPPSARDTLSDWLGAVRTRLDVLEAADAMMQRLSG